MPQPLPLLLGELLVLLLRRRCKTSSCNFQSCPFEKNYNWEPIALCSKSVVMPSPNTKKQFFKWKGVDDWSSIMIFPQWHCLFHPPWYVVSKSAQVKYLSHSLESPLHPCLYHITADQNTEIAVTFLKTCSLATVHSGSLRKIDVYDACGNPTWAQDKIFFPQVAIWVLKFSFPGTSLTFAEVVLVPWVRPLGELCGGMPRCPDQWEGYTRNRL